MVGKCAPSVWCKVTRVRRCAVQVRFLHVLERSTGERTPVVPAWQEATERELLYQAELLELLEQPRRESFFVPASRTVEPQPIPSGESGSVVVRQHESITGEVELAAQYVGEGLVRVAVCVRNLTPLAEASQNNREAALLHTLVSTHAILQVRDGAFVSLTDPPEAYRAAAAQCRNVGAWPVLAGEPGATDTLLCSPIILYDYPQVAPESPGDLFDATEIDEILTLTILHLDRGRKTAMSRPTTEPGCCWSEPRALARDQLLGLHGTMRNLQRLSGEGQS